MFLALQGTVQRAKMWISETQKPFRSIFVRKGFGVRRNLRAGGSQRSEASAGFSGARLRYTMSTSRTPASKIG